LAETLQESEERFGALFEASPWGLLIHDEGRILDANPTLAMIFGYEISELVGMEAPHLVAPGWRDFTLQKRLAGCEEPYEAVSLRRDGTAFPVQLYGKAVRSNGRTVRMVAVRDLTERKRAEEALAYQAQLLACVNDAIISTDEQFILRSWNPAAERIYGWKAEEVIGRPGSEVLRTEFPAAERSAVIEAAAETGNFHGEVVQYRKDGTAIHIESKVIALRDDCGRTTGYVGVNRDITERKRAEEALRGSEERFRLIAQAASDGIWDGIW
jgi:PAS domain S-box-containing protein